MFLVAGLAVAGLAGIAAAFYFSIHSGNRGNKRPRSAGAGHADTGRRPGSRSGGTPRPGRTYNGRRAAGGGTGPDPVPDFGNQVLVGGRRAGPGGSGLGGSTGPATPGGGRRAGARTSEPTVPRRLGDRPQPREDAWPGDAGADDSWPGDSWPADPAATDPRLGVAEPGGPGAGDSRPGSRSAGRPSREAHAAGDAARTAKPRRRVGFRKGAEVDEELWPAEAFGGVSDEQFWDDLASDKPLTRTARTAQQDPGTRSRPLEARSATDLQAQAPGDDRKRDDRKRDDRKRDRKRDGLTRDGLTREDRGRSDRGRGEGKRSAGSGAYPGPRTAPKPAAERTAIQPAYAATQPVQSMTSQRPGATQPVRVASGTSQPMTVGQPSAPTPRASRAPRASRGGLVIRPARRARNPARRARGGGRAAPTRIR